MFAGLATSRGEDKTFLQIARQMRTTADTTKKRYYRAMQLIYGEQYTPNLQQSIHKRLLSEGKGLCGRCPKRADCKDLCPEALRYAEQDSVKEMELIPRTKSIQ